MHENGQNVCTILQARETEPKFFVEAAFMSRDHSVFDEKGKDSSDRDAEVHYCEDKEAPIAYFFG